MQWERYNITCVIFLSKCKRNDQTDPDSVAWTLQKMSVSRKTEKGQRTVPEQREVKRWASRRSAWPMIRFWVSPSNPQTNSYEGHFYSRCGIWDMDCLLGNNEGSHKLVLSFFGAIVVLWLYMKYDFICGLIHTQTFWRWNIHDVCDFLTDQPKHKK